MSTPTAFRLYAYGARARAFLDRYTESIEFDGTHFHCAVYSPEKDRDIQIEFFAEGSAAPHGAVVVYDMSAADGADAVGGIVSEFHELYGSDLPIFAIGCSSDRARCRVSRSTVEARRHFTVTTDAARIDDIVEKMAMQLLQDLNSAQMRECKRITRVLIDHPSSFFFQTPVDLTQFPDYTEYVKHPMDLSTVMRNIEDGKYTSVLQWQDDVERIWKNCEDYNGKDNDFQKFYNEMRKVFIKECRIFDPSSRGTREIPRPVKGVTLNGGRLADAVKSLSTELDLSEAVSGVIPKSNHYSKKDLNPLLDSDIDDIAKNIKRLRTDDERIHVINIFQHFNVPITETTNFNDVDADAIPSEANIYLRSYFRKNKK